MHLAVKFLPFPLNICSLIWASTSMLFGGQPGKLIHEKSDFQVPKLEFLFYSPEDMSVFTVDLRTNDVGNAINQLYSANYVL